MKTLVTYTKAQKAVTILVALGKPRATQLLKYFKNEEKRILVHAAKSLSTIGQPELENLVREFENDFAHGAGILDSSEMMEDILTGAFTPEEVEALTNPPLVVAPEAAKTTIWDTLEAEGEDKIVGFIQAENHQVGAFILTKLSSAKSASVIGALDRTTRASVLTRMISIGSVQPDALEILETHLTDFLGKAEKANTGAGNSRIANILNQMDKSTTDEVLADLSGAMDPDRMSAVKSMLFRFEDIGLLSEAHRVIVFDKIPAQVLTMALRNAEPAIVEVALAAIGQRTRRMIENDLKTPANDKSSEVSAAKRQVVAAILRLSGEGAISLPATELAA